MATDQVEATLRILLIDDEELVLRSLKALLERLGYLVLCASSAEQGLALFGQEAIDLVVSDIRMPGLDGIELVRRLRQESDDLEVILITGYGELDTAVEALKAGAFDLLLKPIQLEELIPCLQRTRRYQEVRREKERLQRRLEALRRTGGAETREAGELIGASQAMQQVLELVAKVAATDHTTVLIQGESGTGKELVARAIHRQSARASGPFVGVNCTAIAEQLLESELFGHEKGAFTDARQQRQGLFELAKGGTLLLDEIGDMSLAAQGKLLRALEERCVRRVGGAQEIRIDVRLIAATNQDLHALIETGRFRQDLYFRIRVFNLDLPPLRARGDDVVLLAHHFVQQYAREFRKQIHSIEPAALERLRRYPFPGNVRELRNLIERLVLLCDGDELRAADFVAQEAGEQHQDSQVIDLEQDDLDLENLERRTIRAALERAAGRKVEAARLLGLTDDALRRRLKKYSLED